MIKKIIKNIIALFTEVYIYESEKNIRKITYKNFFLKEYKSFNKTKNLVIKDYLKIDNRIKRFRNNQILFVLFYKKKAVCYGWMNKKKSWKITEINKKILKKNTLILYDFFTHKNFRNKGFYTKILNLIKNSKTKNKFLIYCLKNNEASKRGILKANFTLKNKMRGF